MRNSRNQEAKTIYQINDKAHFCNHLPRGMPFSSTTFLHQGCPLKPRVKFASTTFLQNDALVGDMRGEPVRLPPSLSEPPESSPRIPLPDRVDSNEEGCGAVQYCNKRVFPVAPASTVRLRQIAFFRARRPAISR